MEKYWLRVDMAVIRPIALGKVLPVRTYTIQPPALGLWLRISKFMKPILRILLCCLVLQAGLLFCLAHDNLTMHPLMSTNAARSSSGLFNFLAEGCGYSLDGTNLFYKDPDGASDKHTPLWWIRAGSDYEDRPSIRGGNHFYDPTKNPAIGLTDGVGGGHPSFIWATVETNSLGLQHSFTWLKTRNLEFKALTNSCQSGRETNTAAMLFYLGHIMHLNQDLSVPAHVRNDNHGIDLIRHRMWTEPSGTEHWTNHQQWFTNNPSHSGWSWWQNTAGFQKLEDFWNRDMLRTNGVDALKAEARGDVHLGLSEFCNGNFFSEETRAMEN